MFIRLATDDKNTVPGFPALFKDSLHDFGDSEVSIRADVEVKNLNKLFAERIRHL